MNQELQQNIVSTFSTLVAQYPTASKINLAVETARRLLLPHKRGAVVFAILSAAGEAQAWVDYLAKRGKKLCSRCEGTGDWAKWTGRTCFKCGGAGCVEIQ